VRNNLPTIFVVLLEMAVCFSCAQTPVPPLAQLKNAAEKGDPIAQDRLADAYQSRLDFTTAEVWYRKAAQKGIPNSQYRLGCKLYERSTKPWSAKETRQAETEEAIQWFLRAANQGHFEAQVQLASLCTDGKYLPQDNAEAYKWLTVAMRSPTPIVPRVHRDNLILKMTQEQIQEGERRAKAFVPHKTTVDELPEPAFLKQIKLNGITGIGNNRLAMINGKPLGVGEQGSIKVANHSLNIRCVSIQDTAVKITVENYSGFLLLRMPD